MMKIELAYATKFDDLKPGDTFVFSNNDTVYLKIYQMTTHANAVCLGSGHQALFDDKDLVRLVPCKLVKDVTS